MAEGEGSGDYVNAQEAKDILGIRQQTLYAYVSRGWIRSVSQPGKRTRLYLREDIERMAARSMARSGHGAVAASAMHWGEPIIPTSITEITRDGPRYRGKLASELVQRGASFESVAELLWTGLWHDDAGWPVQKQRSELRKLTNSLASIHSSDQALEIFALVTLQLGLGRGSVAERIRSGHTLEAARQLIQIMVGCCGLTGAQGRYVPMLPGQTVTEGLIHALAIEKTEEHLQSIEAMLILLADHELSPGAFNARVCASAGSTLHSCIASALCASSGVAVGRMYGRVSEFLDGGTTSGALVRKAMALQERGSAIPGFGHPLYPQGDPRAKLLLQIAQQRFGDRRGLKPVFGFILEMEEHFQLHARHELAIAVLMRVMSLPHHVAGALFVLARTAGWVAHVQEQRLSGSLLRPRAKFVGAASSSDSAIEVD